MAQDQSIEAARARIQRLVDEIANLSKKELRSEEFFQEYLTRAVQATDAKGGAVWLVGQRSNDGKAEFQLAAQVDLESSKFHQDQQQHAVLLRAMVEVVNKKKPFLAPPAPPAPDPSSLEGQLAQMQQTPADPARMVNRTAYPFFHIPLFLREQVLGVLQIWLQPYVTQQSYAEFVTFLTSLATHVEQHLQSRRLGNLVLENQRLQHVLKFTNDIAGSLDPLEVARLAANYGRDLIGCERCSVLSLRGDRWEVLAISGQEVVEKKSSMVKAMRAFVGAHARPEAFLAPPDAESGPAQPRHELLILSKKELISRHGGGGNGEQAPESADGSKALVVRRTDEIDLAYFEHSHVVSAAMAPMFDQEQQLVGAYFAESTAEGFFDRAPGSTDSSQSQRLTEWLATHTGRALQGAEDYRALPFLGVTRRLRDSRRALTGHKRRRNLTRLFVVLGILLLIALYPKKDQVDGNCALTPRVRGTVVPEVAGLVSRILVREGEQLKKGQPIAQLDTTRLETQLARVRSEKQRAAAEADRYRGASFISGAAALLQSRVAEQEEKQLQADIAAATLRSPVDGVLLTKNLELQAGEFLQQGTPFAEVAALTNWELTIDVNEKQIGRVENTLSEKAPLPVNYILYSQSAFKLETELETREQISAVAYPREAEQVFIVTLTDLNFPPALKNDLRPGLTGRAKIQLGREPLIVWTTKRIVDWLRLRFIG
ncbi:MAG: efflux RND transporter periplasmic adaptor subunit [Chthoniobacteraceae bacterium]